MQNFKHFGMAVLLVGGTAILAILAALLVHYFPLVAGAAIGTVFLLAMVFHVSDIYAAREKQK